MTPPGAYTPDLLVPETLGSEVGPSTKQVLAQTYRKYGKLEDSPAGKDLIRSHGHLKDLLPTLKEKVEGLLRGQEKVFGTFGSQVVQEAHCELNDARAKADTAKSMAARCGIPRSDPAFSKARRLEAELERYMAEAVRLHKLSHAYRTEIEQWRTKVEELRESRAGLTSVIKSARRQNHLFKAVAKDVNPSSNAFEPGDWTDSLKRRRPASEPAKQAQGRVSQLFQLPSTSAGSSTAAATSTPRSEAAAGSGTVAVGSLRQRLLQRTRGRAPALRAEEDGKPPLAPPSRQAPPASPQPTKSRPLPSVRPATSEKDGVSDASPGSARSRSLFRARTAGLVESNKDEGFDASPMSARKTLGRHRTQVLAEDMEDEDEDEVLEALDKELRDNALDMDWLNQRLGSVTPGKSPVAGLRPASVQGATGSFRPASVQGATGSFRPTPVQGASPRPRMQLQSSSEVQEFEPEESEDEEGNGLDWLDKRLTSFMNTGGMQESSQSKKVLGELLEDATLREAGASLSERQYIRQIKSLEAELRKTQRESQQARAKQASIFTRRQTLEEFFLRCIDDLRRDVTVKKGLDNPTPRSSTCGAQRPRASGPPKADVTDSVQTTLTAGTATAGEKITAREGPSESQSDHLAQSHREEVVEVLLGSEVLLVHLYKTLFPHRDFYHADMNRQKFQICQPYKGGKLMSADKVSEKEPLPSLSETSYDFLVLKGLQHKWRGFVS